MLKAFFVCEFFSPVVRSVAAVGYVHVIAYSMRFGIY